MVKFFSIKTMLLNIQNITMKENWLFPTLSFKSEGFWQWLCHETKKNSRSLYHWVNGKGFWWHCSFFNINYKLNSKKEWNMTASHLKIVFSYCLYFLVSNNILYLSIRLELKLSKHWARSSQDLKIRGGGACSTVVGIICPPGWDRVNCLAKNHLRLAGIY